MVQITQICKFFVTTLILALTISPLFAKDKAFNDYGNYLEWIYAKEIKDLKKLKKTFKNISLSNVKENTLEELLFESIIFDDWDAGKEISIKLIEINKDNTTANLFLLVDDFLEKKKINFISSNPKDRLLDSSFLEAINIWINKDKKFDYQNKLQNCIPLLCLHYGMKLLLDGQKKKAQAFFNKIDTQKFSSTRVKELQLYSSLKFNNKTKAKELLESLSYKDLNQKDYDIKNISSNLEILNPVLTQKDGLAEVFYNISSWYYQKDLYKFSIFLENFLSG